MVGVYDGWLVMGGVMFGRRGFVFFGGNCGDVGEVLFVVIEGCFLVNRLLKQKISKFY